ncbi:MAG: ImmA/IrrE family metallo-endopeptidase [Phycisphaeraceae bacterium]|nr:ImmA/IrrE family metallo-endopeptidase [Phycisphaeraceae bacterium]
MQDKAQITPNLIVWARTTVGWSREQLAAKISVRDQQLAQWESGEDLPSIAQLDKIADALKRPTAVFFLDAPPEDIRKPKDFRLLSKENSAGVFSPALLDELALFDARQRFLHDWRHDQGRTTNSLVGTATLSIDPDILANSFRQSVLRNLGKRDFRSYRHALEGAGVLATITPASRRILPAEFRGAAIADQMAPLILLNESDSQTARLFTLIHETCHLLLGLSGVSNLQRAVRTSAPEQRVERFCDRFAASVLMPAAEFRSLAKRLTDIDPASQELASLARAFGVSREAALLRLADLRFIRFDDFLELRGQIPQFEKKKGKGGPGFAVMSVERLSKPLTREIFRAREAGFIALDEACEILNLRLEHFDSVEEIAFAEH